MFVSRIKLKDGHREQIYLKNQIWLPSGETWDLKDLIWSLS